MGKTKRRTQTPAPRKLSVPQPLEPAPADFDEPEPLESDRAGFCVAKHQLFCQSLLWDLQHDYFTQHGPKAWSQGEVPHYITSNPTVATAYAEIAFAFHCLTHLTHLCHQAQLPLTRFRYILTDYAQPNLDAWHQHPRFQPFFEQGVLDTALFDINQSDPLTLQLSSQTLAAQTLQRPLVVIANYFFDSIPQDLFYIDKHQIHHCLVSLSSDQDPQTLSPAQRLDRLQLHYDYQPTDPSDLAPQLQPLLRHYQHTLTDTYLLFPTAGLRCLQRLQTLSHAGLLLLSADKGSADLSKLQGNAPPNWSTTEASPSTSTIPSSKPSVNSRTALPLPPPPNPRASTSLA